jgi:hypothetical protein
MSRTKVQVLIGITLFAFSTPVLAVDCPGVSFSIEQTISGYSSSVDELATVDFDHDGKLDLVGGIDQGGYPTYSMLHTWRGVGDGTFEAAVSLGDTGIRDLQVINVNNDAYDDIVSVGSNSIWVRLGNATGFDAAIVTAVDYSPTDLHAGNFNEGTGNVDLVVASMYSPFVVYEGNGNGTFTEKRRVTVDGNNLLTDLTVADFDNDGRFDVALARRMSEQLEVYFRNIDGTFAPAVPMDTGTWPEEILSADFNEDGLPDLASNSWEDGTIDVFLNLGSRAFANRKILAGYPPDAGSGLDSVIAVDINGDSNLDLMAGSVNGLWLTTYLGEGDGNFKSGGWLEPPSLGWVFSIATGNFDGAADADLELALGSYQALFTADFICAPQIHFHSRSPVISSGQTAKLRAVVSGISASVPLPLGTVTFKEGSTPLGTDSVEADGTASLDVSGMALGDHTLTAEFGGNSTMGASTSASIVQRIVSRTTTTTVSVGASIHGVPFQPSISIQNQDFDPLVGYYWLTLDGVTESTKRWSGAQLTLTLNAGPHTISVEFAGDGYNPASTSPTYDFTTAKQPVSLVKTGDETLREGTAHSIQLTVSVTTSPTPTGTIELFRGTTSVGSIALSGGVASFTPTVPRGAYTYTADYSGDSNYLAESTSFTLNTLSNVPLAIDAHGLDSTISVPAVVPASTTSTTMYRSVSGANSWSVVSSWTLISPVDDGSGMTRGVLYDYRLDAIVSGNPQQSNIDSALLYSDNTLVSGGTAIKLAHFSEVRSSVNALRTMAGLSPFSFDGTFGAGLNVLASHVTSLRTAVTEARTALGMTAPAFTDGSLSGLNIKTVHVTDLRDAAR